MANKVTVIGAGSVGATIAFTMAVKGLAAEIVLIDINEKKAQGEAMDISQGISFCDPCKIYAGSYADAKDSDIVVITSGIGRKPGQTRLELVQTNVKIMKSIAKEIAAAAPNAIYIIVSNPVDILTYAFHKITDIPENHIIGTGTTLDSARLRARIADYTKVSQKNIHAYVLGEHGDSSFVPWSAASICSLSVDEFEHKVNSQNLNHAALDHAEIEEYMRTSGGTIISNKGATFYAIALSVCNICECIFSNANAVIAVSTMLHGEYGIDDVCLSIPTIVNASGNAGKVLLTMTDEEVGKLHHSAQMLKDVIAQVEL